HGHIWTLPVSQDNTLLTEGFLALVFCTTFSLLSLLSMRSFTARSGCTAIYTGLTAKLRP
ncbi:hypothetical protein, partial [Shewanella saliphila]|uniref:hypothetical protein n=1 Tax=Shewanella saliphila TaxID=2282698 RepID=UPI001E40ABE7